jgi:hypothetical protein
MLGTGISLALMGMFRATAFSGAIGKITSGRFRAVMAGSGGGAGAIVGVGAGVGSGGTTAAASLCPTAGDDIGIDGTSLATAGFSNGASTAFGISGGAVPAGAGADAVGRAGASRTCKSSAPRRLSFQGKFSPGSPNFWPPKAMLNSSA